MIQQLARELGHLRPDQLTPLMTGAILGRWRSTYARSTVTNYRNDLRHILEALEPLGCPKIKLPKTPPAQPRGTVATEAELAAILKSPKPYLRLFLLLYFQNGLRKAETLKVTPRTWNREEKTFTLPVKGGRTRTVSISPDVEALLYAAGDPDPDTPFISALAGHKTTGNTLSAAWNTHKKRAGINPALIAHDLRRTAATILYNATKDLRTAQELLGHRHLSSTLRYLAPLHPDDARKYAELLRFSHFTSEVKQ